MIKKFFVTLIACSAVLVGCNNDDDNGVNKETKIPVEERNALDDEAIQQYLEDFYFNPKNGKLTKFDTIKGNEDDAYPTLKSLAKQDNLGIWYAENPHHKGTGETIVSNDSTKIFLNIEVKSFRATNSSDYKRKYGLINTLPFPWGSIDFGDGSALVDPFYYYSIPSETEAKNGVKREHVELKNFAEGLKHFKTTNRSETDLYNFQGIIILPSRLAYGRNRVYGGANAGISDQFEAYRDVSYIFNFELPKIEKRVKK
ncbi:hypothetical protein [Empedobacter brevis]|uniref:hypothetical protein n=1 Tax=Empedobacter brevis TaxID=247 RepID=UPI0028AC7D71|nr:hypothetical protein [Empedobacter brevis]